MPSPFRWGKLGKLGQTDISQFYNLIVLPARNAGELPFWALPGSAAERLALRNPLSMVKGSEKNLRNLRLSRISPHFPRVPVALPHSGHGMIITGAGFLWSRSFTLFFP
jgi:hypothetical protein